MASTAEPTNLIDRAIEWAAPGWAASRYQARSTIASYRGAVGTRTSQGWSRSTSYRGGTSRDRRDLGEMRDRARTIDDENVIGGGLLDTETDNVVPGAFSLQMTSQSDDFNAEAEDRFYKWLDKADVSGMATGDELFRASWREPRRDGDGGFALLKRGGYPMLQYIPGDLITNPNRGFDFRTMKDGVEVDAALRPIRFWIRDTDEAGKDDITPIDARDFVYLAYKRKPLTVRGVTVFSRIFPQLDQADTFIDAVTKAAIMGAIFGLIEKRKNPAAAMAGLATTANSKGDQQLAVTYENGMTKIIGAEDSVYQIQAQQPVPQAPDFIRALMRLICLAFDMPIEIGQKDLSQVNFSGGRIGLIGYYRSCRAKQEWLKSRCWNRIVFWWLSVERDRQRLGYPDAFKTAFPADYGEFELHGREWDMNDPVSEAQGDLLEISMGILSEQQACEKRGRDWRKTQGLIASARQIKRDKQIPVVLSNYTRDEKTSVLAVDADGNPLAGGDAAPLNGIQITSAIGVLTQVTEKLIEPATAIELIKRLNIAPDKATAMVNAANSRSGISAGDRDFQREILKILLTVQGAKQVVYNLTDVEDLVKQSGLPMEPPQGGEVIQSPFLPVVADSGPLVSGAVIYDPNGDLVGGDVINDEPVDSPTLNGGMRNVDPPKDDPAKGNAP